MNKHIIELLKPPKEATLFDRGERLIVVDGVIWGRTVIRHHGTRPPSYRFVQLSGDIFMGDAVVDRISDGKMKRSIDAEVYQEAERRYRHSTEKRPTAESLILEKVRELIKEKKLRHPDEVKAERAKQAEQYRQQAADAEAAQKAAFEKRAREALDPIAGAVFAEDFDDTLAKVVGAMKWAQTQ